MNSLWKVAWAWLENCDVKIGDRISVWGVTIQKRNVSKLYYEDRYNNQGSKGLIGLRKHWYHFFNFELLLILAFFEKIGSVWLKLHLRCYMGGSRFVSSKFYWIVQRFKTLFFCTQVNYNILRTLMRLRYVNVPI